MKLSFSMHWNEPKSTWPDLPMFFSHIFSCLNKCIGAWETVFNMSTAKGIWALSFRNQPASAANWLMIIVLSAIRILLTGLRFIESVRSYVQSGREIKSLSDPAYQKTKQNKKKNRERCQHTIWKMKFSFCRLLSQ